MYEYYIENIFQNDVDRKEKGTLLVILVIEIFFQKWKSQSKK